MYVAHPSPAAAYTAPLIVPAGIKVFMLCCGYTGGYIYNKVFTRAKDT